MFGLLCHSGNLPTLGNLGVLGAIGLTLILWVGLLAGLGLLVVLALRRSRAPAAHSFAGGQPTIGGQKTAKDILQARYARGEITRDQYEHLKQDIE